jgi:small subunit ribosomal protein S6
MKHYELLCVLPGTLTEDETSPVMESVKEVLTAEGAERIVIEDKGKNRLTYPIKHIRYGYFQTATFEAEPEAVASIQKKLGITEHLLRALINAYNPNVRKKHTEAIEQLERRKAFDMTKQNENEDQKTETKEVKSEKTEEVPVSEEEVKEKKVDMKEINEKLDALLQGDLEKV